MKDIKQIQEHNRKAIICAVHGTDDYEEALENDYKESRGEDYLEIVEYLNDRLLVNNYGCICVYEECQCSGGINEYFFGKPLTLDRVLTALNKHSITITSEGAMFFDDGGDFICKWDLTKPTLEEQSEETQIAIAKLLGYKS